MKITVLALSTVLLCSTGAFAQASSPATSPDNGSSMSATQPDNPNGNAMQNNATPNGMNGTMPTDNRYRHHHGANWGWIGLFGLLGLFGLGNRRTRDDVIVPTATRLK